MSEGLKLSSATYAVGFDDGRVATFATEDAAIRFAEIDSQLEGVWAVVTRHSPDGSVMVLRELHPTGGCESSEGHA